MKKFLTARWQDLILANYEVDATLLGTRVPPGTELDLEDGRCFVSLVGFMFLETRVFGIPVPFHINFEEVNLRFYIKREIDGETRRAVCFIKEIVPRRAIATVARVIYGEPYEKWQMNNNRDHSRVEYTWSGEGTSNRIAVHRGASIGIPAESSHGGFIIEHYWGYTNRCSGRVDEYKVEHPKWELFSADDAVIDVDFGATYGSEFAFLAEAEPYSVLLAKGSEISVYKGTRISI
jgi:uncharacterized protein YqjF (DUF2071 family)